MVLSGWTDEGERVLYNAEFFAKPPFRSYYFLADTTFLVIVSLLVAFILAAYWKQLTPSMVLWLLLTIACLASFWLLSLRNYRKLHELYRGAGLAGGQRARELAAAMAAAATATQSGLFAALFIAAGLLMQVADLLHRR